MKVIEGIERSGSRTVSVASFVPKMNAVSPRRAAVDGLPVTVDVAGSNRNVAGSGS